MKRFFLVLLAIVSTLASGAGNSLNSNSNFLGVTGDTFLKVEEAYQVVPSITSDRLNLDWQIAPGYYLYKHRFNFLSPDSLQPIATDASLDSGKTLFDDYYQKELEVYYLHTRVSLPLPALPDRLVIESQGCADAGLCYPPRKQILELDRVSGVVTVSEYTGPVQQTIAPADPNLSLILVLAFSLLGGLILNLMPCVFPVLSIKALSLTTSHLNAHSKHLHGLAYTLGIVLSFIAIAAILLGLRASGEALGWGFQLQSPPFIGALVYLFVLMGLSFSGVFYFGTRLMNLGQSSTQGTSLQSSFMTGVLATVVASPCTAPFMGSAIGIALTQSNMVSLMIFATLGFGMALPFLLLSWWPSLSRLLPKPGPWMETFKQLLAFPLYLSATWLLWVLGRQTDMNIVAAVIVGIIFMIFAIWLSQGRQRHPLRILLSIGALLVALGVPLAAYQNRQAPQIWEPFSESRLTELRNAEQRVFVNLTADWCITCLANEKMALSSDNIATTFAAQGVFYLKGDWTNYDSEITTFLNQHGRSGVPLYLFYEKGAEKPLILPQLLTEKIIINTVVKK